MIDIHCLQYSRAVRVVWLMEDLGQGYNLIEYPRTDAFRAPPALAEVHELGKSPVVEDGKLVLAESATILRYLVDKFADTTHRPDTGTREFWQHEELFDYVESAFAAAAMGVLLPAMTGSAPSDDGSCRRLRCLPRGRTARPDRSWHRKGGGRGTAAWQGPGSAHPRFPEARARRHIPGSGRSWSGHADWPARPSRPSETGSDRRRSGRARGLPLRSSTSRPEARRPWGCDRNDSRPRGRHKARRRTGQIPLRRSS
ncbi:Glutathione S-transferase, N-terminal domain [Roseivivax lentus]|uniref:Glutathione S-transferase, N-terminal domain n=1 Tax=Roseivivax lentus TaxID=633194 RepID=A0A1N7NSX8_9RHOB|nr:Glutathione S-transferase, N-terminal domain [Roseivivax lentus]